MSFYYVSTDQLIACLISPHTMVQCLEEALRHKKNGSLLVNPKSSIIMPNGGYSMVTHGVDTLKNLMVVKSLVVNPSLNTHNQSSIQADVQIIDALSGRILAILDGNWITAQRTAAVSALAARHLANPTAKMLGLIGLGVQAKAHAAMFRHFFPLSQLLGYARTKKRQIEFARFADLLELPVKFVAEPNEILQQADIVVSATTTDFSTKPFLDARLLKKTSFCSITDLGIPWLPHTFSAFGRIFVDDLQQEKQADSKLADPALIHGDLDTLVQEKPILQQKPQALLWRGLPLADIAISLLYFEKYQKLFFAS